MARDWSTFTKRITVNYPMRSIYEAWAIPSQIERWFLRSAEYVGLGGKTRGRDLEVEAGDGFLWRWHGHLDDVKQNGTIMEANGLDTFAFTFSRDSLVSVRIVDEKGETIVELTQSGLPDEPDHSTYIGDGEGWTFYLANLKSILEGGIDLRNKNVDIKGVVNS
jgi:uncharacterized protein YndB with AHSA1/START domain